MLFTTFNLTSKPASQQHAPIPPNRTLCSSNRTTIQQCIFETSSCFHKELTSSCRLYMNKFRSVILLPDSWSPAGHNSYKPKTRGSTANGAIYICNIHNDSQNWWLCHGWIPHHHHIMVSLQHGEQDSFCLFWVFTLYHAKLHRWRCM